MKAYNLIKELKQKFIEGFLTKDKIKKFGLGQEAIVRLIEKTGEIEKYLTKDKIEELRLRPESVVRLIEETGKIEKYLTKDKRDELNLDSDVICELIIYKHGNKKEEIGKYLTEENIEEFRLGTDAISKLIAATGEIGKYLTKENIQKFRFESDDIVATIKKAGVVNEYLVTGKIAKLGLKSGRIAQLIEETGEIGKYLTKDIVTKLGLKSGHIAQLIEETGEIGKYLTKDMATKSGLSSAHIAKLIEKTGETERYLMTGNVAVEFGLNSSDICELIAKTGKIEKYLTKENVTKWGLKPCWEAWKLISIKLNDNNIDQCIYDLGFDHTFIFDSDFLYKNLDYILEKENKIEKKEIIKKLYKTNNDIVKAKFEILDNKYLQTLGEDKINLISCYPEYVDKILALNETELSLLGRCLNFYEKNNETEDWTPLCERIIYNISTYSKLLETIGNIDEISSGDIEDLTTIMLQKNSLNIECIEDVRNFQSIKQKKCREMFKNGDTDDKINAICISKFGQSKSEIEEFIRKYAYGIEYIEDEDLQYYIKSIAEIISISNTKLLEQIFESVEPVKNVNSIAMERNLKNEYGKLYNKELFTIKQAQKCENLGDNIYEVPIDENGKVANFSMIITALAPYVNNNIANFYEDWNRPSIKSQHFCASYIRRDMLRQSCFTIFLLRIL